MLDPQHASRAPSPCVRVEGFDADARAAARARVAATPGARVEGPLVPPDASPAALVDALTERLRLWLRAGGDAPLEAIPEASHPAVAAVGASGGVLETARDPLAALEGVRAAWLAAPALLGGSDAHAGERLLRHLDDLGRRTVFGELRHAWMRQPGGWPMLWDPTEAVRRTEQVLGPRASWLKSFRQYTYTLVRRLVVIPTWQCELRCAYCFIPKQEGRVMRPATLERAVEFLLATELPRVWLQFFGGEALIEWDNVRGAIAYAARRAEEAGKQIGFVLSSNGWTLTPEKLAWLAQYEVHLELSLDGGPETQRRFRPARWRDADSYTHSIAAHADAIVASGLDHHVIMVVHPRNVGALYENFFHIADLGFRAIQINNMLGRVWTEEELETWKAQLFRVGKELVRRRDEGRPVELVNLRHRPEPMRLNGEVTVDWDGVIFGGNAFLHETEHKDLFRVAHLDDATHIDRYWMDATDNNFLLDWSYRPKVTRNNLEVGNVMASFCKWLRSQGLEGQPPEHQPGALIDGMTPDALLPGG